MSEPALTVERLDGVAKIVLDLPGAPVNTINRAVRDELDALLDSLGTDDSVKAAVLISGKPGSFIAGADIDEFVALESRDAAYQLVREGQRLVNRLARLGKPVVAAIHGACLGGGLETALACSYRIAAEDSSTKIGLPEVQIGILPAAGGCQRLPRLIGVSAALDLILTGKRLDGRRALRKGIVDELVHPAVLERSALDAARRLGEGWKPKRRRGSLRDALIDGNPLGRRLAYGMSRKAVATQTGGHYPAPMGALRAVEQGMKHGMEAGLDMEASLFAELAVSDVSRRLVEIFFATTALKKDPGVRGQAPPPRSIDDVAIVGAGFMGAAVGGVAVLQADVDVRFQDTDLARVGSGLAAAQAILTDRVKRKRLTRPEYRRKLNLLSGGTDWQGFGRVDLVVEAVFEDVAVKHEVLRALEEHVRDDCIIASNTSTIPIRSIAEQSRHPERMLGMHFFSPVQKMPLLEIIVTEQTAPWVTVSAVDFGRRMGKTVIVVEDHPGFWVNRILAPYLNEAGRLLAEGEPVEAIDRAMTKWGFPVGPITLLDEVGLDVAHKASHVLQQAFGDRLAAMPGLARLTSEGRLGRKSSRGFYRYEGGKKRGVDLAIYEIVGAASESHVPRVDVTRRLVYTMLNEAARAVDEGVVRSPRDGDIGAVFGIGFPPFRGGPLRFVDAQGCDKIVETLRELAGRYGERFAPAANLVRMADRGERFYPTA
ncbi:MAG TPA: fatty acid oxidation complex subunit alpha FadJ [Gemmatimonadales bacterium]|jgi:3-hydroxyacyl-CoA dehydrogenase/enoyl-CoA hydratase/3-hydroxybutyryl-CoA epimerase